MQFSEVVLVLFVFCEAAESVPAKDASLYTKASYSRNLWKTKNHDKGRNSELTNHRYEAALSPLPVTPTEPFPYASQLDEDGDFFLFWRANATHIVFETHVRSWGYVGLGISLTGEMYPADVIIGWVTDAGNVHLSDRFTSRGHYEPIIDESQDWVVLKGFENDFGTVLQTARRLETFDFDHDIKIEPGPTHVIYAFDSNDPIYDTGLPHHGSSRRGEKILVLLEPTRAAEDELAASTNSTAEFRRNLLNFLERHENVTNTGLERLETRVNELWESGREFKSEYQRRDFRLRKTLRDNVLPSVTKVSADLGDLAEKTEVLFERAQTQGRELQSNIQDVEARVSEDIATLATNITRGMDDIDTKLSEGAANSEKEFKNVLASLREMDEFKTEMRSALKDVSTTLSNINEELGRISSKLTDLEDRTTSLESTVTTSAENITTKLNDMEETSSARAGSVEEKLAAISEDIQVVDGVTAALRVSVASEVLPELRLTAEKLDDLASDVAARHRSTNSKVTKVEAAQKNMNARMERLNSSTSLSLKQLDRQMGATSAKLDAFSAELGSLGNRLESYGLEQTLSFVRVNGRIASSVLKLDSLTGRVASGQNATDASLQRLRADVGKSAIRLSLLDEGLTATRRALGSVEDAVSEYSNNTDARLSGLVEDFHRSTAESDFRLATLIEDVTEVKSRMETLTFAQVSTSSRLRDLNGTLSGFALSSDAKLGEITKDISLSERHLQGILRDQETQLEMLINDSSHELDRQLRNLTSVQVTLTSDLREVRNNTEVKVVRLVKTADGAHYNRLPHARVELYLDRHWYPVCYGDFRQKEARVVCRHLGFPDKYVSVLSSNGHVTRSRQGVKLECAGTETEVTQCSMTLSTCEDSSEQLLACFGGSRLTSTELPVRLLNGTSPREGRVEVLHKDVWGTICDDHFSDHVAVRVCRSLGFEGGVAFGNAYFGRGAGPIWMDDVVCKEWTWNLSDCYHLEWGVTNCGHGEDVGVRCT